MNDTMPEPPDLAYVLAGHDGGIQFLYQRDDESAKAADWDDARWFDTSDDDATPVTWEQVCADEDGEPCPVVRLYRADDPVVTGAFNAGVEAAANAIETHAEGIDWYEGSGVWADAIEEARKATAAGSVVTIERPDDDHIEVYVNGVAVASANHDEHGWSGMDAVEKTALAVARALGGAVNA